MVNIRNNPLSMKYGFGKRKMKKYSASLGIGYVHISEVGIQSKQRHELNTQTDYDKMFAVYRDNNLNEKTISQNEILKLCIQYKRIALACFKVYICQYHRKLLAAAIKTLPDFNHKVKHI